MKTLTIKEKRRIVKSINEYKGKPIKNVVVYAAKEVPNLYMKFFRRLNKAELAVAVDIEPIKYCPENSIVISRNIPIPNID